MDLLKYEFTDSPPDSYNGYIGTLVSKIRHFRSVPIDEFKSAMPELKSMEQRIQRMDASIGQPHREYIKEIMEELDIEDVIEEKIIEDVERSMKAIVGALFKKDISLTDISYDYLLYQAVPWVTLKGYADESELDGPLLVIKECFRSACYKHGAVFIDLAS